MVPTQGWVRYALQLRELRFSAGTTSLYVVLRIEPGPHACQASALPLEPHPQPSMVSLFNFCLEDLSNDNAVHCVIGMWSWAIVIGIKKKTDFGEIILAGFLASVIDVDHFLLARSLSLKAALSLPRRPFFHCSTVILVVVLILKLTMHLFKLKDSWCFLPWMLFISWTSHHIRDGIRHGLWMCPFGKTSPLPFWLYVITTSSLPHICSFAMYLTGTRQVMSSKHGIHIDV
ncbi:transmembrane protein 267 isoform X1 [Ictidomys tridecemlineatus]